MRLTTRDVARIRELRYEDGLSARATAEVVGCAAMTVYRYAPGYPGKIDNVPVREAFLASGLSASEVARRIGWRCTTGGGEGADSARLKRALGLQASVNSGGARYVCRRVDAETAGRIAEALGLMPWEVGA